MCVSSLRNYPTIFRLAMLSLVLSALAPRLPHFTRFVSRDLADGFQGLFVGIAVALVVMASRVRSNP